MSDGGGDGRTGPPWRDRRGHLPGDGADVDWPGRRWRAGRSPRHPAGFVGCLLVFLVVVVGVVTALATWLAGTLLGVVAPGVAASAPTAFAVIVVIVLALTLSARTVGRSVGPLAAIAEATERLADGAQGVRVPVAGPGPVRRLAASFNAMADRLDRSRSDRQALLADVTHELRTPLQVIGGSVEAMLDRVHERDDEHLAAVLQEVAVMNRLLDDLRTVSLAEAGALPLHREPVDVQRVAEEVALGHATAASAAGIQLHVTPGAPLVAEADPVRLREMLANLVVNGIRNTPSGGTVTVAAQTAGPWLELSVADTGRGIRPEDLERIFDRFHHRADSGGSGLGLTIVRDLAAAHGGTVTAESEGEGRGTVVRVRLPRRD